jgi:hypothetical protein
VDKELRDALAQGCQTCTKLVFVILVIALAAPVAHRPNPLAP